MNKMNKKIEIQIKREKVKDEIRSFLKKRKFLEVETPLVVKDISPEPYINPLSLEFYGEKNNKHKGYLITSPEYSLKKLLSFGFENIFEITKAFRQKEFFGGLHNPEFTILEWYRTKADYKAIMKDIEELVFTLNKKINKNRLLTYQGIKIDLTPPWLKISIKKAFQKYAKVNLDKIRETKKFRNALEKKGYKFLKNCHWNDFFYLVFLNEIEPKLPKNLPVILYDYPLYQAALAKRKSKNSFYAERFEVFIAGMEIANAFSELTDWKEQLKRLKEDQKLRKKLNKEFVVIDKKFIEALKSGIPESAGIAVGIDRLEMLILDIKDINDLLLFPAKEIFLP